MGYLFAAHFNLFENLIGVTRKYEAWELDELFLVFIALAFGIAVVAVRRWFEMRAKLDEQERTGREIRESKELVDDKLSKLSKYSRYMGIVAELSRTVHSSLNPEEVMENAVDNIYESIEHAKEVVIYIVEGEYAVAKVSKGHPEEFIRKVERIPYPKGLTWRTIIEEKERNVADTDLDDAIGPAGREHGIESYVSIPLERAGRVVGCLVITAQEKNAFDSEDVRLFEMVALQVGDALDNARQAEALKANLDLLSKKNRYETIIGAVTRSVHQSIDLEEVFENAVDSMSTNIDKVGNVCIYIVEGEEAVMKAYRGYPDWFIERVRRIPYPKGFTWKTILEGKPRYVPDVEKDGTIGPAGKEVGTKSYLSMPIKSGQETVGCININFLEKDAFDEDELKLLERVAQEIEVAIANARQADALRLSQEKVKVHASRKSAIASLGQTALSTKDLSSLLDHTVELVSSTLGVEYCKVLELMPSGDEFLLRSGTGWMPGYVGHATVGAGRDSQAGYTLLMDDPVVVEDLQSETRFSGPSLLYEHDIVSGISAAIHTRKGPWGVIGVHSSRHVKFTSYDTSFLTAITNILAQYIDRMEAEAGLRTSEARLAEAQRIAGLGNWVWDIENNDVWWSDQVYRMFGLSPSEFKPSYETFINIVHPDDRDCIEKSVAEFLNGKKAMNIYYRVVLPNGTVLTFHDMGEVTFDGAGRPIMVTGTVRDVTKEREAEEALRRSKEELEQRVEERTSELARANKILETEIMERIQTHEKLELSERRLRSLHEITAKPELPMYRQIEEAIKAGAATLSIDIAMVCRADGKMLEVESVYDPTGAIERGMRVDIDEACCGIVLNAGNVVAIDNLDAAGYGNRRYPKDFNAKSYVGVPLWAGAKVWGTLCFAGSRPREVPLDQADREFVLLLGRWVAAMIERKEAGEALEESERRYRAIVEDQTELICRFTPEGRITFVNSAYCRYFGKGQDELIGSNFFPQVPDEDRALARRHHTFISTVAPVHTLEYRVIKDDGEIRWLQWTVRAIVGEDGQMVEIQSVGRDITNLKLAEEELRESEGRFRALADNAPVMIWTADTENSCTYVNKGWLEFTGKALEDELGEGWLDSVHAEDYERCVETCTSAFAAQRDFRMDFRLKRHDGEYRWVLDYGVPRFTSGGKLIGYIGTCIDITDRKLAEEQTRKSLLEKDIYLREIHHRVKNNLQIIISLLDLQSRRMSDGILRGIIKESKDRIHSISLIHEQLYCSNDFTKVDCGEYIRTLANHLFRSFGVESDTIDLGFSMGDVSLTLDTAIPLGLIINELVSNSIKHAFPSGGGGEIKIDFGKKNGSEYELVVADNGVGLPAGLDISHTKSLGLRLVNILVKQLNGTLDSYPCEGVGFKIRFH